MAFLLSDRRETNRNEPEIMNRIAGKILRRFAPAKSKNSFINFYTGKMPITLVQVQESLAALRQRRVDLNRSLRMCREQIDLMERQRRELARQHRQDLANHQALAIALGPAPVVQPPAVPQLLAPVVQPPAAQAPIHVDMNNGMEDVPFAGNENDELDNFFAENGVQIVAGV
eukprot:g19170.t1